MMVKFLVKKTGVVVEKEIPRYDEAFRFVQKLKRSKTLVLMACWELVECM